MANIVIAFDKYYDSMNVLSVVSSVDALDDGYCVVADTLVAGELDLYNATKPAAITDGNLAIVAGSEVYQDTLGNRPNITDKTQYTYPKGLPVSAYRAVKHARFFFSDSTFTGTAGVGKYLIPTANGYGWTVANDLTANPTVALKIEQVGFKGTFAGFNAVTGVVVRVVVA